MWLSWCPASGNDLATFDDPRHSDQRPYGMALALRAEAPDTAVIAWLGYQPPAGLDLDAVTGSTARRGAKQLRAFVRQVSAQAAPGASMTLICHRTPVVCGLAAPRLPVDNLVFLGSPGPNHLGDRAAHHCHGIRRHRRDGLDSLGATHPHRRLRPRPRPDISLVRRPSAAHPGGKRPQRLLRTKQRDIARDLDAGRPKQALVSWACFRAGRLGLSPRERIMDRAKNSPDRRIRGSYARTARLIVEILDP